MSGWYLLPRLQIIERSLSEVQKDWDTKKGSIGMSDYTLDEFKSMRKNDRIVIFYSYASKLDMREFFDMMGVEYSAKARAQIEHLGYTKPPRVLFVSTPDGYCQSDDYGDYLDRETIDIDGSTAFPY